MFEVNQFVFWGMDLSCTSLTYLDVTVTVRQRVKVFNLKGRLHRPLTCPILRLQAYCASEPATVDFNRNVSTERTDCDPGILKCRQVQRSRGGCAAIP